MNVCDTVQSYIWLVWIQAESCRKRGEALVFFLIFNLCRLLAHSVLPSADQHGRRHIDMCPFCVWTSFE